MKATIIIPTYNGEKYLNEILKAINKQIYDKFEVLIIDSGSTDKTIQIIKRAQKTQKNIILHEIPNSEFGHGKTRNLAANMANGEYLVFISHDAVPAHKYWLYEITKPFEINEKIVGVLGRQTARPGCFPLLKYEIRHVFDKLGSEYGTVLFYNDKFANRIHIQDTLSFYSDVNSATRRDFLVNVLPYKDVPYSEDQIFGREIIKAGYIKAYAPRARVHHSNDMELDEYKHRMFDEIIGLKRSGAKIQKVSILGLIKRVVIGSAHDSFRIIIDNDFSIKRKLYWLLVNPIYHFEKWRGVRLASRTAINDYEAHDSHSLEKIRKR
ncbi:glycosyltransferase family 2 protein [Candidatus Nomurabacteria bacterium]|nr:glycosyltransferase family 2 protein [Candidatus Nomurabacteria bacterium]